MYRVYYTYKNCGQGLTGHKDVRATSDLAAIQIAKSQIPSSAKITGVEKIA